jgi:hypothetical protein
MASKHTSRKWSTAMHEPDVQPKRRKGRGRLIPIERLKVTRASDPENEPSDDQTLTEIALESADSDTSRAILREHGWAADCIEHVFSQVTPGNERVLVRVIENVEPGDSLREIARNTGFDHTQVGRALEDARGVLQHAAIRIKRRRVALRTTLRYSPRGVSEKLMMEPHKGAVISLIGTDQRTPREEPISKPRRSDCRPEIEQLHVPRARRIYVEHTEFGRGIVLAEYGTDAHGPAYAVQFKDGMRRKILVKHLRVGH